MFHIMSTGTTEHGRTIRRCMWVSLGMSSKLHTTSGLPAVCAHHLGYWWQCRPLSTNSSTWRWRHCGRFGRWSRWNTTENGDRATVQCAPQECQIYERGRALEIRDDSHCGRCCHHTRQGMSWEVVKVVHENSLVSPCMVSMHGLYVL